MGLDGVFGRIISQLENSDWCGLAHKRGRVFHGFVQHLISFMRLN